MSRCSVRVKAALSVALISFVPACVWPSPERQLLLDFFQACRVYDRTVLARLATIDCNPRTDGVVQAFDVVNIDRTSDGRRVTVRARVRAFEGGITESTLVVSIERRDGRWVVSGITPPRASQISPAASSVPPR
jgi:hypothetical protein